MNRLFIYLLALSFAAQAAIADEFPLIRPKNSPLKLAKLGQQDLYAEFNGRTWITGTLIVHWYARPDIKPEYLLIPDKKSRAHLPHFSSYGVRWIEISNGQEAYEKAGGALVAVKKTEGDIRYAKITGAFEVSSYVVGVECDAPWARAVITNVDIPNQRLVASLRSPERC